MKGTRRAPEEDFDPRKGTKPALDRKRHAETAHLRNLINRKHGLIHDLLTDRLRVPGTKKLKYRETRMAKIENHKYSIEEAFRECFYIVPDYQREYVWTDKEVHQLLDDIDEQLDTGTSREYFIGTVLVSPTEQKNHYHVIDDQQRLTTFFLLLCAVKQRFRGDPSTRPLEG